MGVKGVRLACVPKWLRAGRDKHENWRKEGDGECASRAGKAGGIAADSN